MKHLILLLQLLTLLTLMTFYTSLQAKWYKVESADIAQVRLLNGDVEAVNKATVSAQTSGRVAKINYDVDDYVAKGSVIVEFTNAEQKSRLSQAQANQKAAKIAFEQAQKDYLRIKDIFAKKLIAKSKLDQALSHSNALKAKYEAAQSAVKSAQKQFDYTIITAPFDGIVTKRYVEQGETVNPGTPIMEGLSLSQLRVVTHIPEKIISSVKQNLSAKVIFNKHEVASNKITVFPYADKSTRTFKTRLEVQSEELKLYPGMTVKVAFKVGQKSALLIPHSAIIHRSELTLVYVKNGDNKLLRHIKLGSKYDTKVEVIAGLAQGEEILLDPLTLSQKD